MAKDVSKLITESTQEEINAKCNKYNKFIRYVDEKSKKRFKQTPYFMQSKNN